MTARLALAKGDRLFDGINHPTAATVLANNLRGALLYCGTPGSAKNVTPVQYATYKASGLWTVMCYEHSTTDIVGGRAAGRQNALRFLSDALAKGVDFADPALPAVDEHVSAADIPTAVAYQDGFRATLLDQRWTGPVGVYGFPEVTRACHDAGVADFYFGAGSLSAQPAFVNIWQDNTATILVGGSADDQDWIRIPLPRSSMEEQDMSLDDRLPPVKLSDGKEYVLTVGDVLRGMAQYIAGDTAEDTNTTGHPSGQYLSRILAIGDINSNVNAIKGSLPASQAALLAAINAHGNGGSIADMETAFAAVLGDGFDISITPKAQTTA